ncbi:MAG: type IV pilus biogenesis/stability protein PilW [Lautropia sp.]
MLIPRSAVAACLLPLAVAACVSTETSRSTGTGQPGSTTADANSRYDRGAPTSGDRDEELRRRSRIRLELASTHFQQGNYRQAMVEGEEATKIDPRYPQAHGMLGLVHWKIGDVAAAEASFRRALELDPQDAEMNNNFGWFLCKTGRQKASIAYFTNASSDRLYASPAKPLHNAGICSLEMGDEAAAENYFLRAFQVDPGNAVAMFNLGEIYLKRGNVERAKFYSDRLNARYEASAETLWLALRVARLGTDRNYTNNLASQLQRKFPDSREATLLRKGAFGD